MKTDRWKKIREIFEEAMGKEGEERDRFIAGECAGDESLLLSVKKMLAAQEDSDGFIEPPEAAGLSNVIEGHLAEAAVGTRVGAYEIRRLIASGGMGTVYEALQESPQRVVALKMMRRELASSSALRRFQYESELLAKLRHPGIAQIFEAGTHIEDAGANRQALPYFAMEYIEGAQDLLDYARKNKLNVRDRLELFCKTCEGVYHGHQRGVIHRDLKPANILVDASGQPKIIDFGVARAIDAEVTGKTLLTETGQVLGTLQYMSPEQLKADPEEVDTLSDIYALGVLLYELLTGLLPHDVQRKPIHEAARIICEDPPRKPGAADPSLSGDLEWILLKAMEKDRERRYGSVVEFAADVRRYLDNKPVLASPPSTIYRLRKFIKRNRVGVLAGVVVALSLIATTIFSNLAMMRAEESRAKMKIAFDEKEEQRKLAEEESEHARLEAERLRSAMTFIRGILSTSEPGRSGSKVMVLEAIKEAEGYLNGLFTDQPALEAEMRFMLGTIYHSNGMYGEAVGQFERAFELRRRDGLENTGKTFEVMTSLAENLLQLDRVSEAHEICRAAFEMKKQALGPNDGGTLDTAVLLGRILRVENRLEESEAIHRDTVERSESNLGMENRITIQAQNALALTLQRRGKYEESEKYCLKALETKQRKTGMDSPDTVGSLANLGQYYIERGRWEEAEKINRKAHELGQRIWDQDHPTMLLIANNLAVSLRQTRKPDEAADLYSRILERVRLKFGPTHRNVLITSLNYATLLGEDLKRHEEAELICRDTLLKMRKAEALGPEHSLTLKAANTLGTILQDSGRLEEAEEVLEEVVSIAWRTMPAHAWEPGWFQGNYAGCLLKQKRYSEAEQAYFKGYERLVPVLGFQDSRTRTLIGGHYTLYKLWEKPEKAKALQDRMKKDAAAKQ